MRHSEHLSALAPGARLNIYRVEGVLGAGGFGITYRAREDITERAVAIKEYLPSSLAVRDRDGSSVRPVSDSARTDFEWGLGRFRDEAKLLIGLKHPNIVPVLSYFEANGTGYLVMEFQAGRSLGDMLADGAVLGEAETLGIVGPLLDGVEAVHTHGFLHRDIKPDNIFVRTNGSPVLLDFGAARQALGRHSKSLTAVLTEGYAPYEQYHRDGNQGPWTDIYAIGAVMLRCLIGAKPAEAPKRVDAHFRGAPDPLAADFTALRERVAPATARAIEAALGLREVDRPQSIAAFRALLQPAPRAEASVLAGPAPGGRDTLIVPRQAPGAPSYTKPPPPRRRRVVAYAVAGAVLFGSAAFGAYMLAGGDRPGGATDRATAEKTAAEEAKRRADAEARRKADEEKARIEAERAKAEAEAKKRTEEEAARRKSEEERKAAEEKAKAEAQRKKAEEERKAAEEKARLEDERKRKAEEEEARRRTEDAKKADALRAAFGGAWYCSMVQTNGSKYAFNVTIRQNEARWTAVTASGTWPARVADPDLVFEPRSPDGRQLRLTLTKASPGLRARLTGPSRVGSGTFLEHGQCVRGTGPAIPASPGAEPRRDAGPRYSRPQLTQLVYRRIMATQSQSMKMYSNADHQRALYVCIDWNSSSPDAVTIRGYGYGYGYRSVGAARDTALQYCRRHQAGGACECTLVDGSDGPALTLPGAFAAKYAN